MKTLISKHQFPKLKSDVTFNVLNDNEYIICNLKFKHYLKINKKTFSILQLMDGSNSLEEICNKFNKLEGSTITTDTISQLIIGKLFGYGIFENIHETIKEYKKPSYLKLSFIIIPATFLSILVPNLEFLFKKTTAILTILLSSSLILTIFLYNINLYTTFSIQNSLLYFFLIMTISVTIHEIGHAAAAHYFGAQHGGIGGGFYLFTPVYYADVTDIWRLNQKQRIIVNFAGIYFELIFCSILTTFSFIFGNSLLMFTAIIVFSHTIFNLNPFFRSDGYWILSDLLNKPNLFLHATKHVKAFFSISNKKSIKASKWKSINYILFIYGLSSLSLLAWFVYYVLFINTNSILMFPMNLKYFIIGIFDKENTISLIQLGQLIVPLVFYLLAFKLFKTLLFKIKKSLSPTK